MENHYLAFCLLNDNSSHIITVVSDRSYGAKRGRNKMYFSEWFRAFSFDVKVAVSWRSDFNLIIFLALEKCFHKVFKCPST